MTKKIVIFCLDGFTWEIADGIIRQGVMPFLGSIISEGIKGISLSTIPCETGPAWTSFMTGCYPGKTGIYTFQDFDKKSSKINLASHDRIAVPTLWDRLDTHGKSAICVNLPMMSPPPAIRGGVIPGLMCPGLSPETVYPSSIYKYIEEEKDYGITWVNTDVSPTVFIDHQIAIEQARGRVVQRLIRDVKWDVLCVHIHATDTVQHYFLSGLDRTLMGFTPENNAEALRFYHACDNILKTIYSAVEKESLVLFTSDHGFTRVIKSFNINYWLRQKGYLSISKTFQKEKGIENVSRHGCYGLKLVRDSLVNKSSSIKIWLKNIVARFLSLTVSGDIGNTWIERITASLIQHVDVEKSCVIALGGNAGLIYFKVSGTEKINLREKLSKQLLEEFGKNTSNYIIDKIENGEDVYGKDALNMPDLVVHYRRGVNSYVDPIQSQSVYTPDEHRSGIYFLGTHSPEGIIVMHGPGVKRGGRVDARIVDIMPTVLAYMGLPVPRHVDGRVLQEAFERPLDVSYEDAVKGEASAPVQYSESEQAAIEKKLGDLGYL